MTAALPPSRFYGLSNDYIEELDAAWLPGGFPLSIYDATGLRLEGVVRCNLPSGEVLRVAPSGTLVQGLWPKPLQARTASGALIETWLQLEVAIAFHRSLRSAERRFDRDAPPARPWK